MVEEARLGQQAYLARLRHIVDPHTTINGGLERASVGRAWIIPTYQYLPSHDEDKDIGYIEPAETGAVVPLALPLNVKFDISSIMIQLLNLKGVSFGAEINDANMHLANFTGIYTSYTIPGVD